MKSFKQFITERPGGSTPTPTSPGGSGQSSSALPHDFANMFLQNLPGGPPGQGAVPRNPMLPPKLDPGRWSRDPLLRRKPDAKKMTDKEKEQSETKYKEETK